MSEITTLEGDTQIFKRENYYHILDPETTNGICGEERLSGTNPEPFKLGLLGIGYSAGRLPGILCERCRSIYAATHKPKEKLTKEKIRDYLKEEINHPEHYGGEDNPYEAIKVIEAWKLGFNLGNTVKYIARSDKKENRLKDLKKAAWYLNREIENMEKENV